MLENKLQLDKNATIFTEKIISFWETMMVMSLNPYCNLKIHQPGILQKRMENSGKSFTNKLKDPENTLKDLDNMVNVSWHNNNPKKRDNRSYEIIIKIKWNIIYILIQNLLGNENQLLRIKGNKNVQCKRNFSSDEISISCNKAL